MNFVPINSEVTAVMRFGPRTALKTPGMIKGILDCLEYSLRRSSISSFVNVKAIGCGLPERFTMRFLSGPGHSNPITAGSERILPTFS